MHIVLLYTSVLCLLYVGLSARTIRMRRVLNVPIGDAGNELMLRAMRVHSNFAEYVPLSLMLIFFVEISGAHPLWVHGLGISLLVGRVSHAYGVSQVEENRRFRSFGMVLTFAPMIIASLRLFYVYVITGGG